MCVVCLQGQSTYSTVVFKYARSPSLRSTGSLQQTLSPFLLPIAGTPHPTHQPAQSKHRAIIEHHSNRLIDEIFARLSQSSGLTLTFSPVMSWTSFSGTTLIHRNIRANLSITFRWRKLKYLIRFSYGTLHALRISHVMDCRQYYRGCSQYGVRWLIVRVVCLYRSQARRPNDLYLHAPTQSPVKSLRPGLLVVCPLQNSTYNQT